jgi:adenylate cyclase
MAEERIQRRLAAILAADVVGYSRLMGEDEAGTLAALKARRREVLEPLVAKHQGRVFKTTGDGAFVEFTSAVNAVQCAVELQQGMAAANADQADERRIVLRIGINLGDVMVEGGDLYGDGINIAARLETIAQPGGILISGTVYDHIKSKVKVGLDDLGAQTLKNIAEPVRAYRVSGAPVAPIPAPKASADRPSIAVLPFTNMSGDPEQEYFSDGITEDIITALSRISNLLVIARTSTFTYKGQSPDVKRIAKELGVRYVMEGSVRRAGERLRVTAQLIDATTGHHLWAERFDRPATDIFEIQDEITRNVTASTETRIVFAESEAANSRRPSDLRAWDLVMRGFARGYDKTREAFEEAYQLADEAIRIDPTYPPAHMLRTMVFLHRMAMGQIPHDAANLARGLDLAKTYFRHAPQNEMAHWLMGVAYARFGQLEDAVAACERGLTINPNCSIILGDLGLYLAHLGRAAEAIEACQLALRLNPRDPSNFRRQIGIAAAHFVAADYEAALQGARKVTLERPDFSRGPLLWAASAAALNRSDEARAAVARCLAQEPDIHIGNVVPHHMPRFARDADRERLLAMLRKAGLPE